MTRQTSRRLLALALGLFAFRAAAEAQETAADAERSGWRYRRLVGVAGLSAGAPPFASLALPPEVQARCAGDLRDLRLVSARGEVPYVVDRALEREVSERFEGRLVDMRREQRLRSVWVVDLGEPRTFSSLELVIREQDFAKRVDVEASAEGQAWRGVATDAGVFDRPWSARVHHTTIALPQLVEARYLRLSTDDRRSKPITLEGVFVERGRRVPGHAWERRAELVRQPAERGLSRYRLSVPGGVPFEGVALDAADAAFFRPARLLERIERNGRKQERLLAQGTLYRWTVEDGHARAESLRLEAQRPAGGELVLEIRDEDSPPLEGLEVTVSGPELRLIFPVGDGELRLYYGNLVTRAPLYDLAALRARLGVAPDLAPASLGPEDENPRYQPVAPLAFAGRAGAALDASRWQWARPLAISGPEDLYTLALSADDCSRLRPDLGDLRIADGQQRQVPYILEADAAEERLDLQIERESAARRGARAPSRFRLSLPAPRGETRRLPLAVLELDFAERFFSRRARLLDAESISSWRPQARLFEGLLSRAPSETPAGPLALGLPAGSRYEALVLEIDDGDDAPLTLRSARAVVRVPRVAFEAAAGSYSLLLRNPEATAPRYDLASLRQEVLAYSALPVTAGPAERNPSYRRRASDYFADAPPTLVLWGALGFAVIALLLLTARVLRKAGA